MLPCIMALQVASFASSTWLCAQSKEHAYYGCAEDCQGTLQVGNRVFSVQTNARWVAGDNCKQISACITGVSEHTPGLCVHEELMEAMTLVSNPAICGGGTCGPTPIRSDRA